MLKEIMRDTEMTTKEKMEMAVACLTMLICVPVGLVLPLWQKVSSLSGKMVVIRNSVEMVELYVMVVIISILGAYVGWSLMDGILVLFKAVAKYRRDLKNEKWLI